MAGEFLREDLRVQAGRSHPPQGRPARVSRAGAEALLSAGPGVVVFLAFFRAMFNPRHVGWLFSANPLTNDIAATGMGWLFYANSAWSWPPGSNPHYGGEIANSLLFTDSVPAFAVPLKLVVTVLGIHGPTQVVGIALLLCLILQSALGYALLRAVGRGRGLGFCGAGFMSLMPSLVQRWNIGSLFWQWVVLAGILIMLLPMSLRRRMAVWCGVVAFATGVTPYLALMLLVLGTADLLVRGLVARSWRIPMVGMAAMAVSTLVGLYLWGTFSLSAGAAVTGQFGEYAATGTSLIDAAGTSRLFPDLPGGAGSGNSFEGFAYLGAGVLLLLITAMAAAVRAGGSPRHLIERGRELVTARPEFGALAGASLLLAGLSVLPTIAVGSLRIRVPMPDTVKADMSAFRANGRFMWPLMYVLVVVAVASGGRVLRRGGAVLVVLALALQVFDVSPLLRRTHAQAAEAAALRPEYQPQLDSALSAPGVDALQVVPAYPSPLTSPWREIGLAASRAGLPLDSIGYFNRYDPAKVAAVVAEGMAAVRDHALATDTVYVVSRAVYDESLAGWRGARVLFAMDDWLVVRRVEIPAGPQALRAAAKNAVRPSTGFSHQETDPQNRPAWWLTAPQGLLALTGPAGASIQVSLLLAPPPCGPVVVQVGGHQVNVDQQVEVTVPAELGTSGETVLAVRAAGAPCRRAGDLRPLYVLIDDPLLWAR